jgi:ABC-type Na+ efflux pump permease subunit
LPRTKITKRDYGKIGALLVLLSVVALCIFGIASQSALDEAQKFFGYTLVLLFALFAYFQYFKEYTPTR